ncbi:MAG: MFS transporter [Alphaproteobacteria bacterium]|jgi:FSR family fosmidomycin resistance protein-like MFS transporter
MTTTTQTDGARLESGGETGANSGGETAGDIDGGAASARSQRLDARVIGPVGGAHFLSHYMIFLLPPILPLLKADFGVGYAALGLIMTVFNLASGLTHVPMGFLVDRFGARRLLLYGVAVSTITYVCMGAFAGYTAMLVLAAIAGVANSVYHPADYALLSASVSPRRMGRAFSLHTFAGFAGGAMAPLVMAYVSLQWGWRMGLMTTGLFGLAAFLPLIIYRRHLSEMAPKRPDEPASPTPTDGNAVAKTKTDMAGARRTVEKSGVALLLSTPIIMCFLFFVMLSMSQGGLSTFAVAAFIAIQEVSLQQAQMALTMFLVGSAVGVLLGGYIADHTRHHEWVAVAGFLVTAVVVFVVGNVMLSAGWIIGAMALAGLNFGAIMPSRDMLVRAVTPEGSMGKVFGFVSTGLNLGGAITPVFFGWLMDQGEPRLLFWFAPAFMLLATVTVLAARFSQPKAVQ